jgi:hypothetical protein
MLAARYDDTNELAHVIMVAGSAHQLPCTSKFAVISSPGVRCLVLAPFHVTTIMMGLSRGQCPCFAQPFTFTVAPGQVTSKHTLAIPYASSFSCKTTMVCSPVTNPHAVARNQQPNNPMPQKMGCVSCVSLDSRCDATAALFSTNAMHAEPMRKNGYHHAAPLCQMKAWECMIIAMRLLRLCNTSSRSMQSQAIRILLLQCDGIGCITVGIVSNNERMSMTNTLT